MSREFGWINTIGYAHSVMRNVSDALTNSHDEHDRATHKVTPEVGKFLEKYIHPLVYRACSEEAGDASHDIMEWLILIGGVLVGAEKLKDSIEEIEMSGNIHIDYNEVKDEE